MEKDFDKWNEKKKILDGKSTRFLFHPGEIWWCSVGLNVGSESYGKGDNYQRPVLVLKKLSSDQFIGLPVSTQKKVGSWFVEVNSSVGIRWILLYQIKMFSAKRLQYCFIILEACEFEKVKQKLEILLELCNHHQGLTPGSLGTPQNELT